MISFSYEEQAGKRYLVYERKSEDALDVLTLEMIRNNKVKGLAPFTCIQIDEKMLMKYDITGLISIREYLSGVVGRQKLLDILEKISDVLIEAEEYLLEISSYVFEENYVYVLPKMGQVVMIVLPVAREMQSQEIFFKKLLLNVQYDQKEDCSYVAGLINFLSGTDHFSVYKFKEQLDALKGQKTLHNLPESLERAYTFKEEEKHREKVDIPVSDIMDQGSAVSASEENQKEPVKKSFLKKIFGKKEKDLSFSGIEIPGRDHLTDGGEESGISKEQLIIPEQKVDLDEKKVEQKDFGGTVFIDEGEAETFFFGKNQKEAKQKYFLQRCRTQETYEIAGDKVRIGRNPSASEICISGNRGIGRVHAIFYVRDETVYIADNNSKNKTFVHGVQINPQDEPYRLHSGDRIWLGDEEFEFYIE